MSPDKIKQTVSEAIKVDREIREKERRLKDLKKSLILEASTREEEHVITEGKGASMIFECDDGMARVTLPGLKLKDTIDGHSEIAKKIIDCLPNEVGMEDLFEPYFLCKPREKFRLLAIEKLGALIGQKVIRLCESENAPRVTFETKGEK